MPTSKEFTCAAIEIILAATCEVIIYAFTRVIFSLWSRIPRGKFPFSKIWKILAARTQKREILRFKGARSFVFQRNSPKIDVEHRGRYHLKANMPRLSSQIRATEARKIHKVRGISLAVAAATAVRPPTVFLYFPRRHTLLNRSLRLPIYPPALLILLSQRAFY